MANIPESHVDLIRALRLDLLGPGWEPTSEDSPLGNSEEILDSSPIRWCSTGFLATANASLE